MNTWICWNFEFILVESKTIIKLKSVDSSFTDYFEAFTLNSTHCVIVLSVSCKVLTSDGVLLLLVLPLPIDLDSTFGQLLYKRAKVP